MGIITKDINEAVAILNKDGIIAMPTETVYGLAGNIYSEKAIHAIFGTKQRPYFNPLIVHIHSITQLNALASSVPEKARQLAQAFWPGPLTLILPKHPQVPDLVTGGKNTVAVRMPNHPMALALLEQLDFPLAAPSANPFGSISPTSAAHVVGYFQDKIPVILDGGLCKSGIESTIVGFKDDVVILYRLGAIAQEAIEAEIGQVEKQTTATKTPDAPGMLLKHYSPTTNTVLVQDVNRALEEYANCRIGLLTFKDGFTHPAIIKQITLSSNSNLEEAAAHLYAALHELDTLELDIIIAEELPDYDLGASINDRLRRAASK